MGGSWACMWQYLCPLPAAPMSVRKSAQPLLFRREGDDVSDRAFNEFCRILELKTEVSPHYLDDHFLINEPMRRTVVEWIIEVCLDFGLSDETMHLAVSVFDRYLACTYIEAARLQLLAVVAVYLAWKVDEDELSPPASAMTELALDQFSKEQLFRMEYTVVQRLDHQLLSPSSVTFLFAYADACAADDTGAAVTRSTLPRHLKSLQVASMVLCTARTSKSMLAWRPSLQAAAALVIGRAALGLRPCVPAELHAITTYPVDLVAPCARALLANHEGNALHKLNLFRSRFEDVIDVVSPKLCDDLGRSVECADAPAQRL